MARDYDYMFRLLILGDSGNFFLILFTFNFLYLDTIN